MIIYNVTSNVHESLHDRWLTWMQQEHIPAILATQLFNSARIVRVLVEEEMGGVTYSVQYETDDKGKLEEYYQKFQPQFQQEVVALFGEGVLSFRTELELISEH